MTRPMKIACCGQNDFHRSSVVRGHFTGLLWSEDILQAFCGQKNFHRFSVTRLPFTGLLCPKDV